MQRLSCKKKRVFYRNNNGQLLLDKWTLFTGILNRRRRRWGVIILDIFERKKCLLSIVLLVFFFSRSWI